MYKWNSCYDAAMLRSGIGLLSMYLSGPDCRVQFQHELLMWTESRELGWEGISQEAMLSDAEHLRTLKRERGCETERGHVTLGNRQGWKTRQVITLICGHMALQAFV